MHYNLATSDRPRGHTLIELVVAMAASAFLLAGMGSVMFIAREVAYTPTGVTRRAKTAEVVAHICDELRYATLVIQQTPQILEFVVADRNSDGTDERIRYEWSGVAGAALRKSINGGSAIDVLPAVNAFSITLQTAQVSSAIASQVDSAETALVANTAVSGVLYRDIDTSNSMSQSINPATFSSVPANVMYWNLTRFDFYGAQNGPLAETLTVQVRPAGDYYSMPTGDVLGEADIAESAVTNNGWTTVNFSTPIRGLALNRVYNIVFLQKTGAGKALRLAYNDSFATGINDSSDSGATWSYQTSRQMWGRLYGKYTTPGTTYTVTRNYVSTVRISLQAGAQGYARVDASAPLPNTPELLSTYCRTDFDRNPTATNGNGDAVADWAVPSNGTFDTTKLANGIWTAASSIETRPLANFTTTTTIDVRCKNTTVGGNGAVLRINADRQGGQYAPLLVYLQRQTNGTQILSLNGKTSDAVTKLLFSRPKLSGDFVRYRLTILPADNLVNIQINGEDQGTYTYPTFTPTSTTDGYVTLYADAGTAQFDYVDVRVGTN